MTETEPKTDGSWTLDRAGFDGLLKFLDRDRDRAAEAYDMLHRKLIKFFDWRGHPDPEHVADLTLNRVARKLREGVEVRALNPASFVLGVARMVFLEESRKISRHDQADALDFVDRGADVMDEDERETRLTALDRCLDGLDAESRELLLRYYAESGGRKIALRKQLARDAGVSAGVLRLRAHRLRVRLERCVSARLGTSRLKRFSA